jgi:flagellar biosynthesis component FlhA
LPKFSFLLLAAGTGVLAWRAPKSEQESAPALPGAASIAADKKPAKDSVEEMLKLDELSLEVGYGLVPLVDQNQGGQLLARVKALRQNQAQQLGFIVPPVHITDNVRLKAKEYVIALRGVEVARWEMLQLGGFAAPAGGSGDPGAGLWRGGGLDSGGIAEPGAGFRICGGRPDVGAGNASGGSCEAARA